jgi:hypothetical protein
MLGTGDVAGATSYGGRHIGKLGEVRTFRLEHRFSGIRKVAAIRWLFNPTQSNHS